MTTKSARRNDVNEAGSASSSTHDVTGHLRRSAPEVRGKRRERWEAVLHELMCDGDDLVDSAGAVDEVWVDNVAGALVAALLNEGSSELHLLERELARLAARFATVVPEQAGSPSVDPDEGAHAVSPAAQSAAGQVRLLRYMSQLGAQGLLPRETVAKVEPDSHAATVLLLLNDVGDEVYTNDIVEATGIHPTQMSHLFRKLSEDGLVDRRKYGRRATWTLTPTGRVVAESLHAQRGGPVPEALVTAASPHEVDAAIDANVDALEIDRPDDDAWYVRVKYDRVNGDDVFGSERLPAIFFPHDFEDSAYVRGDLASRLAGTSEHGDLAAASVTMTLRQADTLLRGGALRSGLADADAATHTSGGRRRPKGAKQ